MLNRYVTHASTTSRLRRGSAARRGRALAALVIGGIVLASCSTGGEEEAPPTVAPEIAAKIERPSLVFGTAPSNPYRVKILTAPVDKNSEHYMADLLGQIAANNGIVPINTEHYNSSFVIADEDTPRQTLAFHDCQDKKTTPPGLFDGPAYFVDVPIPDGALPAKGDDAALAIWNPSTDQMWEFWKVEQRPDQSWAACWGGRIDNVSRSEGTFPYPYGASASGLVTVGSMISLAEAEAGRIDHAMSIGLLAVAQDDIFPPANRTDGTSPKPSAPPMGARLRLDPLLDIDSLDLTPLGRAVARAAQEYGFIVSETAGTVSVVAESGQAILRDTGEDPWEPLLAGVAWYDQLRNFPWDKVEVVQLGYGAPAADGEATTSAD